jgi:hypothetical protein
MVSSAIKVQAALNFLLETIPSLEKWPREALNQKASDGIQIADIR